MELNSNIETISDDKLKLINNISKNLELTANSIEADCQYLMSIIEQYKSNMAINISSSLEEADIINKYNSEEHGNTYNLPGIFSTTAGAYDLEAMQRDNDRLADAMEKRKASESQRNTTFSLITQTYNDLKQKLNTLAINNNEVIQFIEHLKQK